MQSIAAQLKRPMPRSLFWRAFLILVLPILLLQLVVALVFIQRHYDGVTAQMAESVARELNVAIRAVETAPSIPEARRRLDELAQPFAFELMLDPRAPLRPQAMRGFFDVTGSTIEDILRRQVERPIAIDLVSDSKTVLAAVLTPRGVMRAKIPRRRMNAANPHLLLVWMMATAFGLTAVATVFLRNQVRPIRQLSKAAAAFGRGRNLDFRPSGAEEVRRAGAAFLDMRARIERQIDQRTRLLSGVSHDLKTPLTRMKLALAVGEETEETEELSRDVGEMERMIESFLAFARGEGTELPELADPADLVSEIARDARRRGGTVSLFTRVETPGDRQIEIRRDAVKRCLTNLVDNAIDHGTRVALSVRIARRVVEIAVEDDGPGIAEELREQALRPFTRLDAARNQNVSTGVGLGLSIAMDIVRGHGGALILDTSPRLGGLRATVRLPR